MLNTNYFDFCTEVYKIKDGNEYDKIYEVSYTLKKLKINQFLIEK